MDRYDPNQWTKAFVVGNKDFCIRFLKDTNQQVIDCLQQGQHKAGIAGIDRILNGLITMINAGFDYRSHACFFSWVEGNILLFGDLGDAPDENRIHIAKKCYLDARDFAKGQTAKNTLDTILEDIHKEKDLSALRSKYAGDFPNFEIENLADLNNKLDSAPASARPNTPAKKGGRSWFFLIMLLLLGAVAILYLMNKEVKTAPQSMEIPIRTEQVSDRITESEAETETEKEIETTLDPVEEIRMNIVGTWISTEIQEGQLSPDGTPLPAILTEVRYSFDGNGRYCVSDGTYEEADENGRDYAEMIGGRYWICIGGGGQEGNYSLTANELTLTSDNSVQYGSSVTSVLGFTLDGDNLILEHDYGTAAYTRTSG